MPVARRINSAQQLEGKRNRLADQSRQIRRRFVRVAFPTTTQALTTMSLSSWSRPRSCTCFSSRLAQDITNGKILSFLYSWSERKFNNFVLYEGNCLAYLESNFVWMILKYTQWRSEQQNFSVIHSHYTLHTYRPFRASYLMKYFRCVTNFLFSAFVCQNMNPYTKCGKVVYRDTLSSSISRHVKIFSLR